MLGKFALYHLNPATGKFQVRAAGERLVRHFGCRGGVLPQVGEGTLLRDNPATRQV
jgi:hypothetical protein